MHAVEVDAGLGLPVLTPGFARQAGKGLRPKARHTRLRETNPR